MATPRQIEANRLNSQKSTGPRTPEGKAVSRMNALKSGLDAESQFVAGEDSNEFAQLQHEYITRFQPLTPEERFQVDSLIRNEWILRRLFRAEAHLWEYYTIRASRSEGVPLGEALVAGNEAFRRLERRITLAERSYKDAFAELERLQRARASDPPELASFFHPVETGNTGLQARGSTDRASQPSTVTYPHAHDPVDSPYTPPPASLPRI